MTTGRIIQGHVLDVLEEIEQNSIHCCVTSPPYYRLRQYDVPDVEWPDGWVGQLGWEPTLEQYIEHMVAVFDQVRRVLRPDGTLWLNLGDSYSSGGGQGRGYRDGKLPDGFGPKQLLGVPHKVAFALQDAGWVLRSAIVWRKINPMPECTRDRPVRSYEMIFLLSPSPRYFYDAYAVRRPTTGNGHVRGSTPNPKASSPERTRQNEDWAQSCRHLTRDRNLRDVWSIPTEGYGGKHWSVYPTEIPRRAILAGTSERGCCGTCGAPWTRQVVKALDGRYLDFLTDGWELGCECGVETVPCTVLDPFAGSGTTGIVAAELGRSFVGIDLAGGEYDLGGHSGNERITAAERGQTVEEFQAGQMTLWEVS